MGCMYLAYVHERSPVTSDGIQQKGKTPTEFTIYQPKVVPMLYGLPYYN